jgi:hypothetical protein
VTEDSEASRPVAIDLSPMLTVPGVAAWQALDELADRVDIRQWMVAGGMMVMLHGQRYGVELPRTTTDADVVVDVRAFGRDSMRRVAAQLEELGFAVEASPDGVTRYVRGDAKIDLLAPDGLGGKPIETSPPGRAVMAPGATQALERTETVDVAWQQGSSTTVRVPSLLGAIIAKSAAATEIVSLDRREREKHLGDLAFLVSVAADYSDVDALRGGLTKKDRQRLRKAAERLDAYSWVSSDQERQVTRLLSEWLVS